MRSVAARGVTRASLVRGGAAVAAGGAALAVWPRDTISARSAKQDAEILKFALVVEDLQSAFYAAALDRGALDGELLEYARVVAEHEKAHADHIRTALGASAPAAPKFDFGDSVDSPDSFAATAIELEDLGLSAYNGAAPGLTSAALADAARIVSVEARHISWIRDIVGKVPAPRPTDKAISAKQAQAAIQATGFVR
jgi:Ferritin-like domain